MHTNCNIIIAGIYSFHVPIPSSQRAVRALLEEVEIIIHVPHHTVPLAWCLETQLIKQIQERKRAFRSAVRHYSVQACRYVPRLFRN